MQEIKCPPPTSTARWGRCQEGYGEDPYLQAELGAQYVTGLQYGSSKKYLEAIVSKRCYCHNVLLVTNLTIFSTFCSCLCKYTYPLPKPHSQAQRGGGERAWFQLFGSGNKATGPPSVFLQSTNNNNSQVILEGGVKFEPRCL